MRKSKCAYIFASVSVLGLTRLSQAAVVLSDNFDSYANQAAFEAAWPAVGTVVPISAVLSTAQSVSAPNSIQVPGTATTGQYRNRRSFSETGNVDLTHQTIFSFDFYDNTGTGNPQRNFSNLQDTTGPSATNQLISLGLNNNQLGADSGGQYYMARILGYTPQGADPDGGPGELLAAQTSGAFFKLNDFGVGLRSAGWHNLKVVISTDDVLSTDYAFYVDSVLAEKASNVGTAASIRSYDNIAIGSGLSNGSIVAYFDNVNLQYNLVPEPATLAFLGLGGVMLGRRRRV